MRRSQVRLGLKEVKASMKLKVPTDSEGFLSLKDQKKTFTPELKLSISNCLFVSPPNIKRA